MAEKQKRVSTTINVRLTKENYAKIKSISEKSGRTISNTVNRIIELTEDKAV